MAYYEIKSMVNNTDTGPTSYVLDADYTYGDRYTFAKAFERVEKMSLAVNFEKNGAIAATAFGGRFVVPEIGIIRSVTLYVGTLGTVSGGTTADVLKNAASLFTTATNPVVAFDASVNYDKVTTFDSDAEATVAVGDVITASITALPGGSDSANASLVICIQPNSDTV